MQVDVSFINEVPMAFLKFKRKEYGLTQKQFADVLGMPYEMYRKFEEGQRNPPKYSFGMIKRILDYYENEHTV